ncbi:MAG: RES family NAD+ phosphorylase [Pseudomonadota bacterium]
MIKVWRIVHQRNSVTAFSGEGARKSGGRWTGRGYRAAYTSESLALATLEIIVHGVTHETLKHFVVFCAMVPEKLIQEISLGQLSPNWREDPPPAELQAIGNQWLDQKSSCVLKVPSAIIPVEYNFVINPDHPDFQKIEIGTPANWSFDRRLD